MLADIIEYKRHLAWIEHGAKRIAQYNADEAVKRALNTNVDPLQSISANGAGEMRLNNVRS